MISQLVVALLCAVSDDVTLEASEPSLEMVLEKRPVRLERPFEYRRLGAVRRTREGILFRVAVPDASPFAARGAGEPHFVYGKGVCETLRSPIAGGDAIVLCPVPARKEPSVLWVVGAGVPPAKLQGAALDAEYARATRAARRRALPVSAPDAGTAPVRARDLTALRMALFRARAIPAAAPAERPARKAPRKP